MNKINPFNNPRKMGPRGAIVFCKPELEKRINSAVFPGTAGGPLEHIIAAKAVAAREAMGDQFRDYQYQIILNAKTLADRLMERGNKLVSGGTDNHLMLIDLSGKSMTGLELQKLLGRAHIAANKNTIPGEKRSPFVTSGLRLGTPAVTTRGMSIPEMIQIADMISDVIDNGESVVESVSERALALCRKFPLYGKAKA